MDGQSEVELWREQVRLSFKMNFNLTDNKYDKEEEGESEESKRHLLKLSPSFCGANVNDITKVEGEESLFASISPITVKKRKI